MNSWESIAVEIGQAFVARIKAMPRVTIDEFLKSKKQFPSVYIIFNPEGDVIYVGRSRNTRKRLFAHLTLGDRYGILWYVCEERGIPATKQHGHKCSCGEFIDCVRAKQYIPPKMERIREVSKEIRRTYTVVLFDESGDSNLDESIITRALRPKYHYFKRD